MSPPDRDFENLKKIYPPNRTRDMLQKTQNTIEELITSTDDPQKKEGYFQALIDFLQKRRK